MQSIAEGLSETKIRAQIRGVLFKSRVTCPRCRRRYSYKVSSRYFCGKCRLKFSLKSCLVFKGSRLPFTKLWQLAECWLGRLSISQSAFVCGLSEPTVRRWHRRFSALVPAELAQLSGVVEVDESFIGRRKHGNQQIVIGGIERSSGRIALSCIPDRESGSTDAFLLRHVRRTSLVWTDSLPSYDHIGEFFGYGHERCNHSLGVFGPTNRIENVWMRLRRFIRKTVTRSWRAHLPRIIREFQARVNHPEAFKSPLSFLAFAVPTQLG
jgi:transposase-like protein